MWYIIRTYFLAEGSRIIHKNWKNLFTNLCNLKLKFNPTTSLTLAELHVRPPLNSLSGYLTVTTKPYLIHFTSLQFNCVLYSNITYTPSCKYHSMLHTLTASPLMLCNTSTTQCQYVKLVKSSGYYMYHHI
jgi:hypothetical protein